MFRYYEALADAVPGPLMLYNIPLTTHHSLPLHIIDKLSHHPKIVGLKDSEGDAVRFEQALHLWRERDDFSHLAGTERLAVKALLLGSDGIVPSTGNIVPRLFRDLYEAAIRDDEKSASALWHQATEIGQVYLKDRVFSQSLPALKAIMNLLGFCEAAVMPPLYPTPDDERAVIAQELQTLNIHAP